MSEQPDIKQIVSDTQYAATSGTGDAVIHVHNYYYRESGTVVLAESTLAAPDTTLPCPYRGLFHFGPNDAGFFFGRETVTETLIQATKTQNFITLLGASGSGKSSVVLAGLVPKLKRIGQWEFTHFRPGADPFLTLATALVPLYTPDLDETDQMPQARKLADYLRDDTLPLSDVIATIQRRHPNHRALLIADQFEELYTLCDSEKTRRHFLDTVLDGIQAQPPAPGSSIVLVLTMRADFLGRALTYLPFGKALRKFDIKLLPMSHDQLTDVIVKPAKKLGVTFQDGLVKRILNDVAHEPGNLPLLEFALTLLWERRTAGQLTHTAYEDIGTVEGALAGHAEEKYAELNQAEKEQARRILIQLVRPGEGTEDTRRLATIDELGEDNWPLVKRLADARLVVTSRDAAGQEIAEVVHEALIRNWEKLGQWMDKHRDFRLWQDNQLRMALKQWQSTQGDEGALLRGAPLAEAEKWLTEYEDHLGQDEQDFIRASIELRERTVAEREARRQRELEQTIQRLDLALSQVESGIQQADQALVQVRTRMYGVDQALYQVQTRSQKLAQIRDKVREIEKVMSTQAESKPKDENG